MCLGATAAQLLIGRDARIGGLRGHPLPIHNGLRALVSIHPSAVVRAGGDREARRAELLEDLELARDLLARRVAAA